MPALRKSESAGRRPRLTSMPLGQGGAEEGEHAVAGDVAEGGEFEGVVATVELQRAEIRVVLAEGGEHLGG
jgi:hypothetical protein